MAFHIRKYSEHIALPIMILMLCIFFFSGVGNPTTGWLMRTQGYPITGIVLLHR